jgi:hypothetical protein
MFNEEVDRAMKAFDLTCPNISEENREISIKNHDEHAKNITSIAKAVADRQSEAPERNLS